MPNKRIDQLTPNNQPINGTELIPLYNVSNNSTRRAPINDVATFINSSSDTYVTGGTITTPATDNDNNSTLTLSYKGDEGGTYTLPLENTYTSGATYDNGTALATFTRNDGTSYNLDLSTIDVNDTYVTGATLNGTTLEINRNNGEPQINVDLSVLTFTGNTSGTCITDLYLTNLYGCSPITVHSPLNVTELNISSFGTGTSVTTLGVNINGDIVTGATSTDTYVTGATLTGTTLEINQNNGQPQVTVDLSPLNSGPTKTYIAVLWNLGIGNAPVVVEEILNTFDNPFQIPVNLAPNNGRILINSLSGEFTVGKTYFTAFIVENDPISGIPGAVVSCGLYGGGTTIQFDMYDSSGTRQDGLRIMVKIEVYP